MERKTKEKAKKCLKTFSMVKGREREERRGERRTRENEGGVVMRDIYIGARNTYRQGYQS